MKRALSLLVFSFSFLGSFAQGIKLTHPYPIAKITHPAIGTTAYNSDSTFSIKLIGKKQYYAPTETATADKDINSPKSVNMHPNATKYYVNSLEGATTVVYDFKTNQKLKVIRHDFTDADTVLLGSNFKPFYAFTHYLPDSKHPASPFGGWGAFYGKPVESTFTHGGKYLWVPYYRRDYDINAQDPSAVAIIDTETDNIIRLMDTGPLPKMIATSPDGKLVAITQWGDNTVGIINIESQNPFDWHYVSLAIIDQKLELNFSMTKQVDRDDISGYCLRGTAFTPDNHYLLVGCMAGNNGIAVVDLKGGENSSTPQYIGRITGNMYNLRHLLIRDGYVYLSINRDGYIQRMPLTQFLAAIPALKASSTKTTFLSGWEHCKVGNGARTIEFSPDGRYIYAACNASSTLYVVDAQKFQVVTSMSIDSYPVGLEVSKDGRYVFTTSQGRSNGGGNCVDIFEVTAPVRTYTNTYSKEVTQLAEEWVKQGEWRNGFTKASPAPTVNLVEFYLQYQKNPTQWKALFQWLQETDLLAIPAGRTPIPGTTLTVSVEDGDNWCSQDDLRAGKGSESHYEKIDFMYVVRGTEGFCRLDHETSKPCAPYKPDRLEYTFEYDRLEQFTSIPGTFNIMFPCDWHVAKVKTNAASQNLRVLVIKVDNKM